jgi:S1-C subfamily serine protease
MDIILHQRGPLAYLGLGFEEGKFDPQKDDLRRVFIADVTKDSPAAQAGLLPNDTVLEIDGVPVASKAEAEKRRRRKHVGDVIELTIVHPHETTPIKVRVTVTDMDKDGPPQPEVVDFTKEWGLRLKNCDVRELFTYKMRQWTQADFVIITAVSPQGPLAGKEPDKQVRSGDILLSVDGTKVKSTDEVKTLFANRKIHGPVTLGIWRDAQTNFEVQVP